VIAAAIFASLRCSWPKDVCSLSNSGINPDRPDSFAFVANGQAYVKSEAVLRIARELPHWQWTWLFHFVPRVIRDAIYELVARNRYRWFGRRDVCILPNSDRSWPS
jgi:predicted DCC family thiol-disulfide oxidoreductase YuxK